MKFIKIDTKYYCVAHINSTVLKSEIGNRSLYKYPNCDFSAIYSVDGNTTYFSLRSDNSRTDVSLIATKYGGGGHRNAAGLSVYKTLELPGQLIDNDVTYKSLNNIQYKKCKIGKYLEDFNVVFLNMSRNRKHIGKYLLQERSKEGTENIVLQQWCNIIRNNTSNSNFYDYCEFACIWYYDQQNNKVWISLTWADSFISKYPDGSENKLSFLSERYDIYSDFRYIGSESRVLFSVMGLDEFMKMFGLREFATII